jgi:hypothetical protein
MQAASAAALQAQHEVAAGIPRVCGRSCCQLLAQLIHAASRVVLQGPQQGGRIMTDGETRWRVSLFIYSYRPVMPEQCADPA